MDNNNFNQPNQPMPGQMPNQMPNQAPGQMPPMNQGYPNGQGMPGPMPGQMSPMGYSQPMVKPPKQPMDPAKKKKLIIGLSIGGAVLVLGIAAAIVIPILLRVDYSTAYNTAKELKPKIYDFYYSYDCEYAVDYLDSSYTTTKSYNEYVENCKNIMTRLELVDQLGETPGIKRNSDISNQFGTFKSNYDAVVGNYEDLSAKLDVYVARHSFVVATKDISYSSTDAEITAAAKILIDSGNDTLKTYGEGWQEKYLAAARAEQDWYNSPGYFGEKYDIKKAKDTEYKNWLSANKPDIKSLYPINIDDTSKVYSEFTKLYDLISTTYRENYNSGSGDCTEFLGEVYCE